MASVLLTGLTKEQANYLGMLAEDGYLSDILNSSIEPTISSVVSSFEFEDIEFDDDEFDPDHRIYFSNF